MTYEEGSDRLARQARSFGRRRGELPTTPGRMMQQVVKICRRTLSFQASPALFRRTSRRYMRGPVPIRPGATGIHMKCAAMAPCLPSFHTLALHFEQGVVPYGSHTTDVTRRVKLKPSRRRQHVECFAVTIAVNPSSRTRNSASRAVISTLRTPPFIVRLTDSASRSRTVSHRVRHAVPRSLKCGLPTRPGIEPHGMTAAREPTSPSPRRQARARSADLGVRA